MNTAKPHRRTWIPNRRYVGNTTIPTSVREWTWTKSTGLIVAYTDGTRCRSDWQTLREFQQAIKDGRERATEMDTTNELELIYMGRRIFLENLSRT